MFKKGDKVYSILKGWGEVIEIRNGLFYPVLVQFELDTVSYTLDGKSDTAYIAPELYHTEPIITVPERRVEHKGWIAIRNKFFTSFDNQRVVTNICNSEDILRSHYPHLSEYNIQEITYYTEE